MRLLVLSDSHGDFYSLKKAVESTPGADAVIFLGDGLADWETAVSNMLMLKSKNLIAVRGNCDFYESAYPLRAVPIFDGVTVYCTHGHSEFVKHSREMLKEKARECHATVALYGHTHIPESTYDDGLYLMNPGSVRQNSCGIVDITPNGILCFTKEIVTGC